MNYRVWNEEWNWYEYHSIDELITDRPKQLCTEVADSNGNVLYEGDLVVAHHGSNPRQIVWYQGGLVTGFKLLTRAGMLLDFGTESRLTKVGTINENPEVMPT